MKNEVNRALVAKKRFIALLLAIVASVGTMFAESGTCGKNLTWDLTNGVLTISGTGAMDDWSDISSIPWYSKRFSIKEVSIGNSVTSIGIYAFADCTGLTSVTIPESVTSIGARAFYGCTGLTSVTIPNSVTSIGDQAFYYCTGLTSITIPNSVTSIGRSVFYGCSGLTSIVVASGNTEYDSRNNCNAIIETSSNTLIAGCKNTIIPNSVTSIGNYAFYRCSALTSIEIPNSVTSIGSYAFYDCSGLTSVTIPYSVTSIGSYAFFGCTGLTSVTIPNSVTSIGASAFRACSGLTSITIPNSVTSIGYDAFDMVANIVYSGSATGSPWGARSINGYVDGFFVYSDDTKKNLLACSSAATGMIEIPNSVTSIGNYAFWGCSGLTSVTIPNSVTSFGEGAFYECTGLTSVTIPNSVTSIGIYAFADCTGLTSIIVASGNTKYDSRDNCNAIIETSSNRLIAGCKNTIIPNSVTSIGQIAFYGCTGLTSIEIPNSVTRIGDEAFFGCSGLTSITIPNRVTSIGEGAFSDCSGLTSITIPNSVTSIGDETFFGCSGLTSITIPNSVTSIGNYAFYRCSALTSIEIPNSVTSIGSYAFYDCSGLTSITCEAITPPTCEGAYVLYNVDKSIPLYVPAGSVEKYKAADQWKEFGDNIKPIQAAEVEVVQPNAEPTTNSVVIEWPKKDDAVSYTIVIKKGTETICTLTFNADGQLLTISFAAPARNGSNRSREALQTSTGWKYTISGLEANTDYKFLISVKNSADVEIYSNEVPFKTKNIATDIDEVSQEPKANSQKLIKDGQLYIMYEGRMYDVQGKEVK